MAFFPNTESYGGFCFLDANNLGRNAPLSVPIPAFRFPSDGADPVYEGYWGNDAAYNAKSNYGAMFGNVSMGDTFAGHQGRKAHAFSDTTGRCASAIAATARATPWGWPRCSRGSTASRWALHERRLSGAFLYRNKSIGMLKRELQQDQMNQASLVRYTLLAHAALAICLLVLAGCGDSAYPLAGVSGAVTLDDDLLAGTHVAFQRRREGEGLDSGLGS